MLWVPVKNQFNVRKLNLLKVCSIFSQVLKVFSRGEFEKAVKEQKVERYARGFSSCGQFLAPAALSVGAANPGCIAGVVDSLDDHTKDRESLALDVARLGANERRNGLNGGGICLRLLQCWKDARSFDLVNLTVSLAATARACPTIDSNVLVASVFWPNDCRARGRVEVVVIRSGKW